MRIHGISIGWSPFSSTYSFGLRGENNPVPPATALDFVNEAVRWGLAGVEIPWAQLPKAGPAVDEVAEAARNAGLFLNVAASGYTVEQLRGPVETAARIGARAVRTVIGGSAMGGDRRPLAGKWGAHIDRAAEGLARVMEIAEPLGVRVGVENHQDLSSEDLLYILDKVGSPYLGITFDVGNALSTVESPYVWAKEFARRFVDIHIKDYRIYVAPFGYRLVRCPIGQGAIDFDRILAEIAKNRRGEEHDPRSDPKCDECDVPAVIELGAVEARRVPLFEPDYWDDYPPRSARQLAEVMGIVINSARPSWEEWRTPFERGLPVEEIIAWEKAEFARSVEYLRGLADRSESAA